MVDEAMAEWWRCDATGCTDFTITFLDTWKGASPCHSLMAERLSQLRTGRLVSFPNRGGAMTWHFSANRGQRSSADRVADHGRREVQGRAASVVPTASFGFHLAMDTLAVQLTLPLAECVEDSHLQVSAPCRAHHEEGRRLTIPLKIFENSSA